MTRDQIAAAAQQCGFGTLLPAEKGLPATWVGGDLEKLQRFADLVAADVREACAQTAEDAWQTMTQGNRLQAGGICKDIAAAIRTTAQPEKLTCCKGGPQWGHAYDCWMLP